MTTAVRSQQVRDYLDQLRNASRELPSSAATQLRTQIAAHLDERLLPDADEEEIEIALAELGSPDQLVAEQLALTGRSKFARVRRIRRRGWLIVVTVLALVGIVAGELISMRTTANLSGPGGYKWLTAWDRTHSRSTNNLSGEVMETAIHAGHVQGFIVTVTNHTGRAQTILGPATDTISLGTGEAPTIAVSGYSPIIDGGGMPTDVHYTATAKIPPGQSRLVKVSWTSANCYLGVGSSQGSNTLDLRVKVGLFTRNEDIDLGQYIGLFGTSSDCHSQGDPTQTAR